MKLLLAALPLVGALMGCAPPEPIEGTVTFKTIERPYVSSECGGFPLMCNNVVIPTVYRVEITHSPRNEYDDGEVWCELDPHDYERATIGMRVTFIDGCWDINWREAVARIEVGAR